MINLTPIFSALADPTRFLIVQRLLDEGEATAGDLANLADISAPAFSRHFKVLRNAGLVTQRIDGSKRVYAASPEPLRALSNWTGSHRSFWARSLDRLEATVNKQKET